MNNYPYKEENELLKSIIQLVNEERSRLAQVLIVALEHRDLNKLEIGDFLWAISPIDIDNLEEMSTLNKELSLIEINCVRNAIIVFEILEDEGFEMEYREISLKEFVSGTGVQYSFESPMLSNDRKAEFLTEVGNARDAGNLDILKRWIPLVRLAKAKVV